MFAIFIAYSVSLEPGLIGLSLEGDFKMQKPERKKGSLLVMAMGKCNLIGIDVSEASL